MPVTDPQVLEGGPAVGLRSRHGNTPRAMTTVDLDGDGALDLVVVSGSQSQGLMTLYRGNPALRRPSSPPGRKTSSRRELSAFVSAGTLPLPFSPDWIEAGDFDGDGFPDVILAAAGQESLHLLPGNGRMGFEPARSRSLADPILGMAQGELNGRDGLPDLALLTGKGQRRSLLLLESPTGAWRAEGQLRRLDHPAVDVEIADFDGDHFGDVVAGAADHLEVHFGNDRQLHLSASDRKPVEPRITHLRLDAELLDMASGQFRPSRQVELAVALADGSLRVLQWRPEGFSVVGEAELSAGPSPRIFRGRLSLHGTDDVLAAGEDGGLVAVHFGDSQGVALREVVEPLHPGESKLPGQALEVASARLNADAFPDLVLLTADGPQVVLTSAAMELEVNDARDRTGNLIDDLCDVDPQAAGDQCTLREALALAARFPGSRISINVSRIEIEVQPSSATLDVPTATTILGNGAVIDGSAITPQEAGFSFRGSNHLVQDLIVANFASGSAVIGAFDFEGRSEGAGNADLRNLTFRNNDVAVSFDPRFADLLGNSIRDSVFLENRIGIVSNGRGNADETFIAITGSTFRNHSGSAIDLAGTGTIGGVEQGSSNEFVDNANGIQVEHGALVQGNVIRGTTQGPALRVDNSDPVFPDAPTTTVGGGVSTARNLIVGNNPNSSNCTGRAVSAEGSVVVTGNRIGIEDDGSPAGNDCGVEVSSGAVVGPDNIIAFNRAFGVIGGFNRGIITRNSIFSNGSGGISPTNGSPGSRPAPPQVQLSQGGQAIVNLRGAASTAHTVELFSNTPCDASGTGQGETFLSAQEVTTDNQGNGAVVLDVGISLGEGEGITATVTDNEARSTSSFSACVGVTIEALIVNSVGDAPLQGCAPDDDTCQTETVDCSTGSTVDRPGQSQPEAECTLRAALQLVNNKQTTAAEPIRFDIADSQTVIALTSRLPRISGAVDLDARDSQGTSCRPTIGIDGTGLQEADGLVLDSSPATVRGLAIYGFTQSAPCDATLADCRAGIVLDGGGSHRLQCNYVGLNLAGQPVANTVGVRVDFLSDNNRIGARAEVPTNRAELRADRNFISGNSSAGLITRGDGTIVQGNFFGTSLDGQAAVGNGSDNLVVLSQNNRIGGPLEMEGGHPSYGDHRGNLISGAQRCGILLVADGPPGSAGRIQGNAIGTNLAGSSSVANRQGICMSPPSSGESTGLLVLIGGDNLQRGNLISGNLEDGVVAEDSVAVILFNRIGTSRSGAVPLANGNDGVDWRGEGLALLERNTIAFNGRDGIRRSGGAVAELRRNSIFDNGEKGYRSDRPSTVRIHGATLTSSPPAAALSARQGSASRLLEVNTEVTVPEAGLTGGEITYELFSNFECDPGGKGEGERFVASAEANGLGSFRIQVPDPDLIGPVLTLTATTNEQNKRTFEFSNCFVLGDPLDEMGGSLGNLLLLLDRGALVGAGSGAQPDRERLPDDVVLAEGMISLTITPETSSPLLRGGAAAGSATVRIVLPQGATADTYFNYGPTPNDPTPHWYEFLFDGATGAEILDGEILLHFVDGARGDHDLEVNGRIETWGAPARNAVSLYFPFNESDAESFVGIAVSNLESEGALLQFQAFDSQGSSPLPSGDAPVQEVAAEGQLARLSTELVGLDSGTTQASWIHLRSTSSQVGSFFQFGANDLSRLDGSTAIRAIHDHLFFSRVFEGPASYRGQPAQTFVTLANPSEQAIEMLLTLRDGGPGLGTIALRSLPPKGFLRESIEELFGTGVAISQGYVEVEVTSGSGVIGFQQVELAAISTAIGLNARPAGEETVLYSAQMASVTGLFTNVNLINTSPNTRTATLTPIGEDGVELAAEVVLNLAAGAQVSRDIGELFGAGPGLALLGSLRVDLNGPGVIGDVLFGDPDRFEFAAALPLQAATFRRAIFSQVANVAGFFTGLAFFNPGAGEANVTITVIAADGSTVGSASLVIGAGQRRSQLIPELVPASEGQAGGYVLVESDQDLIAQQLFGATVEAGIQLLSAVPPTVVDD